MQERLLVRADGGKELGFGHWTRCLYLLSCYRSILPTLEVILFTRNSREFNQVFPDAELEVQSLKEENDFIDSIIRNDVVLLDAYHITADYFVKLKQKGAFLIYVDDLLKPGIQADIIINHSLGIKSTDYASTAIHTSFYLGGSFSLVAEQFIKNSQNKDKTARLSQLLLCMGGADPGNETAGLLKKYYTHLKDFEKVYIILGQQYQFSEALEKEWQAIENFQVLKGLGKVQVSELMQQCGVAILPASTMAVEYAHVGGVLGIIQTADNQAGLFRGLLKEGVALELKEVFKPLDKKALYAQLIEKQSQVFDGHSKQRFQKLFIEIGLQRSIRLRAAKEEDASLTYRWASDKKVRAFSFSKEEISWEGHQQWFSKKMQDEYCIYLIAELGGVALGSVRFDIKNKVAVISYLIDSRWHGKGLGRIILAEGIKYLYECSCSFDEIVGFVLPENKASMRIFERMGFEKALADGQLRYFKKIVHE